MKRKAGYLLCAVLSILLIGLLPMTARAQESVNGLEVRFLDIGRNDGILVRCGGESAFFDSGLYSYGKVAKSYLESIGISELTYYVGTHAHADHVGGASIIIDTFHPEAVLQPHEGVKKVIESNAKTASEKAAVKEVKYVTLSVGDRIKLGGATLTCLGPIGIKKVSYGSGEENGNSLVLMLTYGDVRILLTGDATAEEFREISNANPGSLRADVLKNAHHNGYTREDILNLINPKYVVFSTSSDSSPKDAMLEELNERGVKTFSTSPTHSGNIILRTDGRKIEFDTQYQAESLTISKQQLEIYEGKTDRFSVSVKPRSHKPLLLYTSSNPSVATVNRSGKVTGVSAGTAVITVSDGNVTAQCSVQVKPAELKFKKSELTVKDGSKVSASYSLLPSGVKTTINWSSSDEKIASVDAKGKITGIYPGEAVITATLASGQKSSIKVTVTPINVSSVSISPSSVSMTIGESRSMTARVSPSNATWTDITWSSADTGIASVTKNGTLTAVGVGKTKLTATAVGGKSRTINVTVKPVYVKKVILQQTKAELIKGKAGAEQIKLNYTVEPANATIKTVEWSSSNKKIASVDENGVVTALKSGSATITCRANDGSGRYARVSIKVEQAAESVVLDKNQISVYESKSATIYASTYPRGSTKKLTYTSSNPSIATVSSSGKVTGVKPGRAIIRVEDISGAYAECEITVKMVELVFRKTEITLKDGSSTSLSYSIQPSGVKSAITWTSKDQKIAVVDAKGRVTGIYPGETVITATLANGQRSEIKVTVNPVKASRVTIKPSSVTMTIGESRSVSASVSPSNATWQEITWSSADSDIVTITQSGMLKAVGVGETTITARTPEGTTRTAKIKVKPVYVKKITLTKPDKELIGGVIGRNQIQISRSIAPADATIQDVEWTSSNKKVAVVDANGVVTGLKAGTVKITCKAVDGSGRYSYITLTFKENELKRNVDYVSGKLVEKASRIRYYSSGSQLEITMTYKNLSGTVQQVPAQGVLTLITPQGEKIPLKQITGSQSTLKNNRTATFTYRIPMSVSEKLAGLDLSRCEAAILSAR